MWPCSLAAASYGAVWRALSDALLCTSLPCLPPGSFFSQSDKMVEVAARLAQTPAQAGSPTAACPGPCPGGFPKRREGCGAAGPPQGAAPALSSRGRPEPCPAPSPRHLPRPQPPRPPAGGAAARPPRLRGRGPGDGTR